MWASSRAARIKITESVVRKFLIYYVIFIVYATQFTSVVAGRTIQSGGPWVGGPCRTRY